MHWSSWEYCWVFAVVLSVDHSTTEGVDCQSAAGTVDVAGSGCNSIDLGVPGTSAKSLAKDWCIDEY